MKRLVDRLPPWIPGLLWFLTFHHRGLFIGFWADDFAWLQLPHQFRDWTELPSLLFTPMAQGTIRPLSERAFFTLLGSVFGLDPWPFRLVVHLTQIGNVVLLAGLAQRLTGSRAVAMLTPFLWVSSFGVTEAFGWIASYNQVLCSFWILLAARFLLGWLQSGRRSQLLGMWGSYGLAVASLETAVAFPAVATLWSGLGRRALWRPLAFLWAVTLGYAALHWAVAPRSATGPYAFYWDNSLVTTAGSYWLISSGLGGWIQAFGPSKRTVLVCVAILCSVAFGVYLGWRTWRNDRLAWSLFGWWLAFIGPVLPLRDHVSAYYLTLPLVGLTILGARAAVKSWYQGGWSRTTGSVILGAFLAINLCGSSIALDWRLDRTNQVEQLLANLQQLHQRYPQEALLLDRLASELFWGSLAHGALDLYGLKEVYLTPECAEAIRRSSSRDVPPELWLPGPVVAYLLDHGRARVFRASSLPLRQVTTRYHAFLPGGWRRVLGDRVEVGQLAYAQQLGPGWHQAEGTHRWMGRKASVRLGCPTRQCKGVIIEGLVPEGLLRDGSPVARIWLNGRLAGQLKLSRAGEFGECLSFPEGDADEEITVEIQLNKVFQPTDDIRELGLAIRRVGVVPGCSP